MFLLLLTASVLVDISHYLVTTRLVESEVSVGFTDCPNKPFVGDVTRTIVQVAIVVLALDPVVCRVTLYVSTLHWSDNPNCL